LPKPVEHAPRQRRISCFDCGAEWEVAATAESTMCKRCSSYVDLHDYRVTNTVSKNFKTKGTFVLEPKGYVLNTEAFVGDAFIRGRLLGRLVVERSLTIYSTAEIKGTFKTAQLIIPAENHFRWPELIKVGSAEISGELVANLQVSGTVFFRPTARFFGDLTAKNLVVESGAVVVGQAQIGKKA
jgi:cytoskeletal protein CcmA (bactofilin family)